MRVLFPYRCALALSFARSLPCRTARFRLRRKRFVSATAGMEIYSLPSSRSPLLNTPLVLLRRRPLPFASAKAFCVYEGKSRIDLNNKVSLFFDGRAKVKCGDRGRFLFRILVIAIIGISRFFLFCFVGVMLLRDQCDVHWRRVFVVRATG
jgi:hypothetical protein